MGKDNWSETNENSYVTLADSLRSGLWVVAGLPNSIVA